MKVPKELIEQWRTEYYRSATPSYLPEYIAQRAAAWALSQPVSMGPVAWGIVASNTGRICQVELDADEVAEHNPKYIVPLYTQSQLAAARQQGAETRGTEDAQRVAQQAMKIASLEYQLSEAKGLLEAHDLESHRQRLELPEPDHVVHITDSETMDCYRADQVAHLIAQARQQGSDESKKRIAGYELMVRSMEQRISHMTQTMDACREATTTLQSERDANAILTERIADLEKSNAALLEALEELDAMPDHTSSWLKARAAIAAAEVKPLPHFYNTETLRQYGEEEEP